MLRAGKTKTAIQYGGMHAGVTTVTAAYSFPFTMLMTDKHDRAHLAREERA